MLLGQARTDTIVVLKYKNAINPSYKLKPRTDTIVVLKLSGSSAESAKAATRTDTIVVLKCCIGWSKISNIARTDTIVVLKSHAVTITK